MDTKDPRAPDWPPPEPETLLQKLREEDVARSAADAHRPFSDCAAAPATDSARE